MAVCNHQKRNFQNTGFNFLSIYFNFQDGKTRLIINESECDQYIDQLVNITVKKNNIWKLKEHQPKNLFQSNLNFL